MQLTVLPVKSKHFKMHFLLLSMFLISFVIHAQCCPSCDKISCDPARSSGCGYGLKKDRCGCCNECAQGPGEGCGGEFWMGKCGTGLKCQMQPPRAHMREPGNCVPLNN